MQIKWYGHACFLITASDGTRIITDPYTPETSGYRPIQEAADLVIRSSADDSFHCRADLVPGQPQVVTALDLAREGGQALVDGVPIQAIEAMEALDHRDFHPEQNGMYRFTVDDMDIGHMGDVGAALSERQIAFFRGVDLLLALAGGHPAITLDDLKALIDQARPRLVIPMHFQTLRYRPRNALWIPSFLAYFDDADVDFALDNQITLTKDRLPERTRVLVMDYVT